MKIAEAKAECERWFAYLDRQREKAIAMQEIAAARRSGKIEQFEASRRVRMLDGRAPVVFDGARLEQAIKALLRELEKRP